MALALAGGSIASTSRDTLLVFDTASGAERWRVRLGARLTGVAYAGGAIVVGTEGGVVARFAPGGGERSRVTVEGPIASLAGRADGALALAVDDAIVLVAPDDRVAAPIPCPDVVAVVWSADGTHVFAACGGNAPSAIAVDPASRAAIGTIPLDGAPTAIAVGARGVAVACGDRIVRLVAPGSPPEALSRAPDRVVPALALGRAVLAVQMGDDVVAVLSDPPGASALLYLTYRGLACAGVALGSGSSVAVALDDGSVSIVDVSTGVARRAGAPGAWDVTVAGAFQATTKTAAELAFERAEQTTMENRRIERDLEAARAPLDGLGRRQTLRLIQLIAGGIVLLWVLGFALAQYACRSF